MRLDGRVAIVTGAGRGIGRAHAMLLAERGAAVVVNDSGVNLLGTEPSPEVANAVAAEIISAGGRAAASTASVADDPESVVATAVDAFGGVDVVVNNAGVNIRGPFGETTLDDFRHHISVHLYGAVGVTLAAWPHLVASGVGRVVNTTSSTIFGIANRTAYSAAKGAIFGFTRSLAVDGEPYGVKANCVAPAAGTRMSLASDMSEAILARMRDEMPPELVAPLVAYLAHEDCAVTGETLSVVAGKVTRIALGETAGFTDAHLTPEVVRDRIDEALDPSSLQVIDRVIVD
ncbi:MAG TPA: SDR family NAD(P)-dependent oxidoreductase [Acidimicrobiales bacterium]